MEHWVIGTRGNMSRFNRCLLTDEELTLDQDGWRTFGDPFPIWGTA
jgi:hypothetical protein